MPTPMIGHRPIAAQPPNQVVAASKTITYKGLEFALSDTKRQTAYFEQKATDSKSAISGTAQHAAVQNKNACRRFQDKCSTAREEIARLHFPLFSPLLNSIGELERDFNIAFNAAFDDHYLQATQDGFAESEALKNAGEMAKDSAVGTFLASKNSKQNAYAELIARFEQQIQALPSAYSEVPFDRISYRLIANTASVASTPVKPAETATLAAKPVAQESKPAAALAPTPKPRTVVFKEEAKVPQKALPAHVAKEEAPAPVSDISETAKPAMSKVKNSGRSWTSYFASSKRSVKTELKKGLNKLFRHNQKSFNFPTLTDVAARLNETSGKNTTGMKWFRSDLPLQGSGTKATDNVRLHTLTRTYKE
jgi:hypothetical protein